MVKNTSLEARILLALAYSGQFEFPLTAAEIWQRLPGGRLYSDATLGELAEALVRLNSAGLVERDGGYWQLPGEKNLSEIRNERRGIALQKMQETGVMIKWLKLIPWVKAVAITGSASMENTMENDDIDFLVITLPERMWLVRPLVIAAAWLRGKRRTWQKEEKNSWCFNMWLDTDHLTMPLEKRSVYGAYEVIQARWLFSKDGAAEKFFRQNIWAKKFLPGAALLGGFEKIQTIDLPNPFGFVLDLLDWLAYALQLWYMKPHRTIERVGPGYAFFHPRDTYAQIVSGWKDQIKGRVNG